MIKQFAIGALLAASAAIAAPAFAGNGYGPAPHYDPLAGAPASQRGQSIQTVHAEVVQTLAAVDTTGSSYGGMVDTTTQSGTRAAAGAPLSAYSHH